MSEGIKVIARLPKEVDERLRLTAALRRKPIAHVLSEVLGGALPTRAELTEQIRNGGADGDH